jgi:4-hydroxy-4-methyl-2-oxoglutarate aldolase
MEDPWSYAQRAGVRPEYRVVSQIERPDPALVDRFRDIHFTALLMVCNLGRSQIMDRGIKPLAGRDWFICGPAVTVKVDFPDVLMSAAATMVCQPGDVIVVAANGCMDAGVWGGSLTRSCKIKGCSGIVIDGVVECTNPILEAELPVFCRGVYPVPGTFEKPGSVNVPVSCGGVTVEPGDLIVGNQDGIAVLPRRELPAIVEAVEERTRLTRQAIASQKSTQGLFFEIYGGYDRIRKAGVVWE